MAPLPATRQSLIARLADGNNDVWSQFAQVYGPLIGQLAERRGLQPADAADITQEVLGAVADAFRRGKYHADRGSFRGWLHRIARNEIATWLAAHARRQQPAGGTAALGQLQQLPAADDASAWDDDYERRLLHVAAERVRREVQPATWQAFWRTAIEGQSGADVAAELKLSVAAVYLAKGRVMKRLQAIVREIDDQLEHPAGRLGVEALR